MLLSGLFGVVHKPKVKEVEQQGNSVFGHHLSKGLAKAHPLTTSEGLERERVARLSLSGQKPFVIWVARVEALRLESERLTPLDRVLMDSLCHNGDRGPLLECDLQFSLSDGASFIHSHEHRVGAGRLEPDTFRPALAQVI